MPGGFNHVLPKWETLWMRRSKVCSSARRRARGDRSIRCVLRLWFWFWEVALAWSCGRLSADESGFREEVYHSE